jgi:hypothetical protein
MNECAEQGPVPDAWSLTECPENRRIRPADALPARAAANDDIDRMFVAFLHFVISDLTDHPVYDDLDDAAI